MWRGPRLRRSLLMRDEPALAWQYLIDTAVLHHQMWKHGESKHAAELRLRFAQIGITPADRQRLKVPITQRVEAPQALRRSGGHRGSACPADDRRKCWRLGSTRTRLRALS